MKHKITKTQKVMKEKYMNIFKRNRKMYMLITYDMKYK